MKKAKLLTIIIIILAVLLVLATITGITVTAIYCSKNILNMYILSFHVVDFMYLILGASFLLLALIALLYWKHAKMTKEAARANYFWI